LAGDGQLWLDKARRTERQTAQAALADILRRITQKANQSC
jgi:hypothetical protein